MSLQAKTISLSGIQPADDATYWGVLGTQYSICLSDFQPADDAIVGNVRGSQSSISLPRFQQAYNAACQDLLQYFRTPTSYFGLKSTDSFAGRGVRGSLNS